MGKIQCLCGNVLHDTCGDDAEIFTEDQIVSVGFYENEYYSAGDGRSVLECEKCGRLLIEDPLGSCYVKYYAPDNGVFNKIFRRG